jgi:hypothetical protein
MRRAIVTAHIELRGSSIACEGPTPKAREAVGYDRHEGSTMYGIKGIPYICRDIDPIRVLIEGGSDGVGDKLHARATSNTNLDRPWGTTWLGGRGGARR